MLKQEEQNYLLTAFLKMSKVRCKNVKGLVQGHEVNSCLDNAMVYIKTFRNFFFKLNFEMGGERERKNGVGGERESERERERERHIEICSTYLCIDWLILLCALTRDPTCNLGVLGQYSNQPSYSARALGASL